VTVIIDDTSTEEPVEEAVEEIEEAVEDAGEEVAEAIEETVDTAAQLNHEQRITRIEVIQDQHTVALNGLAEAVTALNQVDEMQNEVIGEVAEVAVEAQQEAVMAEAVAEEAAAEEAPSNEDEAPTSKEHWFFRRKGSK